MVKNLLPTLDPESLMTDFEKEVLFLPNTSEYNCNNESYLISHNIQVFFYFHIS